MARFRIKHMRGGITYAPKYVTGLAAALEVAERMGWARYDRTAADRDRPDHAILSVQVGRGEYEPVARVDDGGVKVLWPRRSVEADALLVVEAVERIKQAEALKDALMQAQVARA